MKEDEYGEGAALAWAQLPFNPMESNIKLKKGKLLFEVQVYQLGDQRAVRDALNDIERQCPMIQLVMMDAQKILGRINQAKASQSSSSAHRPPARSFFAELKSKTGGK